MIAPRQLRRPDLEQFERVRRAIEWWGITGSGMTSSITGGGAVCELERRLGEICEREYGLAMGGGTLALRAALEAVGVGPGTNVVMPVLDWPAAASAAASLGASPRFADVAPASLLIDPSSIQNRIDAHTRAAVVTHPAGLVVETDAIAEHCRSRGIALIEDISQALGASVCGRPVGAVGTAAVCSIGPGKMVDVGEGGLLLTNDRSIYEAALRATQHPVRQLRSGVVSPSRLGLATRIHPVAAILGLFELETLDDELDLRRRRADEMIERVRDTPLVMVPEERPSEAFSWPMVPALVEPDARPTLAAAGLGTAPLGWTHLRNLFSSDATPTPNADRVVSRASRLFLLQPATVARPADA